jgi:hypothetical protein
MVARYLLGAVLTVSVAAPALAGPMTADEVRKFVSGKVFSFTCFDGTRGAGRVLDDGGAVGAVQFSGSGLARNMRLPSNTLQTRGQSICASIKGLPFEPCFNVNKNDERSFRGSVSGMGFAYCDFHHQGGQLLMARVMSRPRGLHPSEQTRSADASHGDVTSHTAVTARVETPHVEIGKIEPVASAPARVEPDKAEGAFELRRSTD